MVGPSPSAGAAPVVSDPLTPDPSIEAPLFSATELLDLFQRLLYDILFRIVRRLSQAILDGTPRVEDKCTLAFLLLPNLVDECHFGKWNQWPLYWPTSSAATTDEDFGNMVLSQAQAMVPCIQAYRNRTAFRRDSPLLDHTMIASLQR